MIDKTCIFCSREIDKILNFFLWLIDKIPNFWNLCVYVEPNCKFAQYINKVSNIYISNRLTKFPIFFPEMDWQNSQFFAAVDWWNEIFVQYRLTKFMLLFLDLLMKLVIFILRGYFLSRIIFWKDHLSCAF